MEQKQVSCLRPSGHAPSLTFVHSALARAGSTLHHLRALTLLLVMCLSIGNVWGAVTTLTNAQIAAAATFNTAYTSRQITDTANYVWNAYAILTQHSKATSQYKYLQIKAYTNPTAYYIQVPEMPGVITSLKMTVSSSSQPMTGGGNSNTLYFSASNSTSADGDGVVSGTGASSITIDASSLNLKSGYITASGAIRIWDVEVTYNAIKSVAVKTAPKTSYAAGDMFDPSGLVITATYDDDSKEDITYSDANKDKFTFSPSLTTALQTTDTKVTITYGGKSVDQTIAVAAPTGKAVTVTANPADGGEPSAEPNNNVAQGTEVTLSANPKTGYTFTSWYAIDGEAQEITVTDNKFNMPASDVEVEATFTPIAVTGVTLNKSELALEAGSVETLTATIVPSDALVQTLTWASSNGAVATVDQTGKVTAVAAGTVNITATSNNSKVGTCAVTVTPATKWEKVTSVKTNWAGEYLLVYENNNTAYVWTGVDAANCNASATITSGQIIKPADAVSITIAAMTGGYSIQVNGGDNNGMYIGGERGSNTITFKTDAILNTIALSGTNVVITSNTSSIQYNDDQGNKRFRYFKSGSSQKSVQLYEKVSTDPSVKLNKNEISLSAGAFEILTATVKNSTATVAWISDNEDAATVDQTGKVTAVAVGEAKIIAKITESSVDYTDTCVVTVTPAATVTSVTISPAVVPALYIYNSGAQKKSTTLTVAVDGENDPAQTVTWSSMNSEIASVDQTGKVSAVAAGETKIIATSTVDTDKADTVDVKVINVANTKETAFTAAQAIAIIDVVGNPSDSVYVKDTVSKVDSYNDSYGSIIYWLDKNTFEVYGGLGLNNTKFSSIDDVKVGAEVIVKGKIKKYTSDQTSVYEFDKNNYLVSYVAPEDPKTTATITLSVYELSLAADDAANKVTIHYNGNGQLSATSEDEEVATVALTVNETDTFITITPVAKGSAKITVSAPETDDYTAVSKYCTLTVTPAWTAASLPFEFDGCKNDIDPASGIKQNGLGSDYGSSPKLKFDHTGDYVIVKIAEKANLLSYKVKGNSFSGGTFDVLESADGEDYTSLKSYTTLDDAERDTVNLAAATRFIKFIYTSKSSGNVALGAIKIENAVAKIVETGATYATLDSAFAAAKDKETIKLLANINGAVEHLEGQSAITLDLDTFTITSDATATLKNNGGAITITDNTTYKKGAIINTANKTDEGIAVWARLGDIIINYGNFENASNYEATAYVGTSAETSAKLIINGGRFVNKAEGNYAHRSKWKPICVNMYNTLQYKAITINGGHFYGQDPTCDDNVAGENGSFLAKGKVAKLDDGKYVIADAVAQVGDVKYASLAEAFAAAKDNDVVRLLAHIDAGTDGIEYKNTAAITLDLDSFSITSAATATLKNNGGAMTITDLHNTHKATIINTANAKDMGIAVWARLGNITIEHGYYISQSEYEATAYVGTSAETSAKLIIKNGVFKNEAKGEYAWKQGWKPLCVNMYNTLNYKAVEINDGHFYGQDPTCDDNVAGEKGRFLAKGKVAVSDGEKYDVLDAVVQIGDVKYATLDAAFAAATEGATVKLIADIDAGEDGIEYKNTAAITLDLDTFSITSSATATLKNNGGAMTITDRYSDKKGRIINTANAKDMGIAVWARTGDIIIERGYFQNASKYEATAFVGTSAGSTAKLIIKGGKFENIADGEYAWQKGWKPICVNAQNDMPDSSLVIYGGKYYGQDPSYDDAGKCFLAKGKAAKYDGERYVIADAVAQIGDVKYASLADAFAAAKDNDIVRLLAHIDAGTDGIEYKNQAAITLDLDSFSITSSATATLKNNGGAMTITDLHNTHKATIINTADAQDKGIAVWARLGNITIEHGYYISQSHYEATAYVGTKLENGGPAKLIIKSGVFKNIADGNYAWKEGWKPICVNMYNSLPDSSLVIYGGLFYGQDPTYDDAGKGFLAKGLAAKLDGEKYVISGAVAQIGDVKYASLADAFAAAKDNDTVRLLAHIDAGTDGIEYANTAAITLDLDTFTITSSATATLKNNGGAMTITDRLDSYKGTIINTANAQDMGIAVWARMGNITIERGIFVSESKYEATAYVGTSAKTTAKMYIKGGKFENKATDNYQWKPEWKPIVVNMHNSLDYQAIEISGGIYFGQDPSYDDAGQCFMAKGKVAVFDGEKYVISGAVAQIGDVKYASLADAFAAAQANDTVKLLAHIDAGTDGIEYTNAAAITLDLDTFTITSSATATLKNNGGAMTITDLQDSRKGKIINTANAQDMGIAVWARTGDITIERGHFISKSKYEATAYVGTSADAQHRAHMIINNGAFENNADTLYVYSDKGMKALVVNIQNDMPATAMVINGGNFKGNDPTYDDAGKCIMAEGKAARWNATEKYYYITTANKVAQLSDLTVDGKSIAGFKADSLNYTYAYPSNAKNVVVAATAADDSYAKVEVNQVENLASGAQATVVVTAEDRTTTQTYTITFYRSAAKIKDVDYISLHAAVEAAKEGDTIMIQRKLTMMSPLEISKKVIISGTDTIIASAAASPMIHGNAGADLELIDLILDADKKGRAIRMDAGKLTITGATITNALSGERFVGGVFMNAETEFIMKGGSIEKNAVEDAFMADGVYQYSSDLGISSKTKAVVWGGKIGNVYVNSNDTVSASLELKAGEITNVYVEADRRHYASFTYTGGTVSKIIMAINDKRVKTSADTKVINTPVKGTTYTMKPAAEVVGAVAYATIDSAFAAAQANDTVKLLAHIDAGTAGIEYKNAAAITLDLDTFSITSSATATLKNNGGAMTIVDRLDSHKGRIINTADAQDMGIAIWARTGDITTERGRFISQSKYEATAYVGTSAETSAKLIIKNGRFENQAQGNYQWKQEWTPIVVNMYNTLSYDAVEISGGLFYGQDPTYDDAGQCFLADGKAARMVTDHYEIFDASTDASLKDIKVDGATIAGFSATTYEYTYVYAHDVTVVPTVTAETNDTYAKMVITAATSLTGSTTIEVTAEDRETKLTYTINFEKEDKWDTVRHNLTVGKIGTICLPGNIKQIKGARLYNRPNYTDGAKNKIELHEITEFPIEEGTPAVFMAEDSIIAVIYGTEIAEVDTVDDGEGLVGNLKASALTIPVGNILVTNNEFHLAGAGCTIAQYRAYIMKKDIADEAPAQAAGRVLIMNVQGGATPTDLIDIISVDGGEEAQKVMINGHMYIIRNGEMYDANGHVMK